MKIRITQDCEVQGRAAVPGQTLDVGIELAVDLCGAGRAEAFDPVAMKSEYHAFLARERQRNERLYPAPGAAWTRPWVR